MKLYMKRETFTSQRNKYLVHRLAHDVLSWVTNGKTAKYLVRMLSGIQL